MIKHNKQIEKKSGIVDYHEEICDGRLCRFWTLYE